MIKYLNVCLLIFLVNCSTEKEEKNISFNEKKVEEVSILLNADTTNEIASPAWIKSVSDGFLLYDAGIDEIAKFNLYGQKSFSFGSSGRGPGEFQSIGEFWKFDNIFLVYDINGQKLITYDYAGNLIKDIPLGFVDFPGMPSGIEAINSRQFVMPSGGKDGSLLTLVDIESESKKYVGDAVSEKYMVTQSPDERRQAIYSGNIPAIYKNNVLLSSNESGFFSFQQTTAILEKYSHSGALLWQKNLKVPAIDGLFEDLFEENKSRIDSGEFLLQFAYAFGISANNKGVGVLLNVRENRPVTIAWVPNDGEELTVITFRDLENPSPVPLRFAISEDSDIFFSSTLEGVIYRAEWPL
ncbi:hypothetical protein Asal01_01010 [Fodinibius salicampi]